MSAMKQWILIASALLVVLAFDGFGSTSQTAMAQAVEHAAVEDAANVRSVAPESFASAFFFSRIPQANGEKSLDIFGTMLLWLLLLLSMLSVGLIGMMALIHQRKAYLPAGVVEEVKQYMNAGRFREAIELTGADSSFFSRVLHVALREAGHGYSAVIRSLEQASDELTTHRLRHLEYLNILAQVSPMIGLFGTVWGMILAFRSIVMAGGNPDPVMLAGGIGTALTTTFWGLIIAIPALAAYAIIRNRIDQFTTEATRAAEELVNEFRPKPGGAPATSSKPAAGASEMRTAARSM